MTKREKERITRLYHRLYDLGFTDNECETLRKASMNLSRWAERECNGEVERDENTGKPFHSYEVKSFGKWVRLASPVPDREIGAKKRITEVLRSHPDWIWFHQTDPRGAALYLIPAETIEKGSDYISCNYSSIGIAIY